MQLRLAFTLGELLVVIGSFPIGCEFPVDR
jgi:hypothetical protein